MPQVETIQRNSAGTVVQEDQTQGPDPRPRRPPNSSLQLGAGSEGRRKSSRGSCGWSMLSKAEDPG
eukprot:5947620-Pyramimonas_sp.AAC.1